MPSVLKEHIFNVFEIKIFSHKNIFISSFDIYISVGVYIIYNMKLHIHIIHNAFWYFMEDCV